MVLEVAVVKLSQAPPSLFPENMEVLTVSDSVERIVELREDEQPYDRMPTNLRRTFLFFAMFLLCDLLLGAVTTAPLSRVILMVLRFGQILALAFIVFGLVERAFKRSQRLGRLSIGLAIVGLLYLCGFGALLPIVPITHYEVNGTIAEMELVPGVIYERIDPPVERETTFVIVKLDSGEIYFVEEQNATSVDDLKQGTSVVLLVERLGRFAYTRWLMPFNDSVHASELRTANS